MATFVLTENTAAELVAMCLVLQAYLAAGEGERPAYHPIRPADGRHRVLLVKEGPGDHFAPVSVVPLHHRAGLGDEVGARLLSLWANRGWWSPTPSYALGTPTEAGIVAFAKILDALTPDARRTWWEGLTTGQVLELAGGELPAGTDGALLCPACGVIFPVVVELPALRCPACTAPIRRRDQAPRRLVELEPGQAEG